MRDEPFGELDRIARAQVRPFGTIERGQLGMIFKVNPRSLGLLQERIPNLLARHYLVLDLLQLTGHRAPNEHNLAAAGAKFVDSGDRSAKARADGLADLRHENIFRDVTRR